nr:SGNH/GDSL hydrolase family protein [Burkholderia sp. Ac-20384]
MFAGDSIFWGALLPENPEQNPRDGTLADPRDNFESPSFANEFKRYIGRRFFPDAEPVHSNWSFSRSGQSTTTYTRELVLFPGAAPFLQPILSGPATSSNVSDPTALRGRRQDLAIAPGGTGSLAFRFTGTEFAIIYHSVPERSADYEVFVNDASLGVFSTDAEALAHNTRRTHTFDYVRDALVRIEARYPAGRAGVHLLRLSGIVIRKTCTIINNSIIGIDTFKYAALNFGKIGPSIISPDLNYVIMQLGTNDRIAVSGPTPPNTLEKFRANLQALIDKITPHANLVLMNALPAAPVLEAPPTYVFTTADVRDVIHETGAAGGFDVIDNHSIFDGMDTKDFTSDRLHPNQLGHGMIAANMIGAFEVAS